MKNNAEEFWALTRVTDSASDANYDEHATIYGTPETVQSLFDLSRGVPFGWRLYKGKAAKRFMHAALKEELRYQREQEAKRKSGGIN
jgi:hypothetical protein